MTKTGKSKIGVVRGYLVGNRKAKNEEILAMLKEQGFESSLKDVASIKSRIKKEKSKRKKTPSPKKSSTKNSSGTRTRKSRPYPASSFEDAMTLGKAIHQFGSGGAGEKIRRLTLLSKMNRAPNSGATNMLITNSNKYNITQGSYSADYLELTEEGKIATDPSASPKDKLSAQFALAVKNIAPFDLLYNEYVEKKLPAHEMMHDFLNDSAIEIPDIKECVDLFVVNIKNLNLLQTIGGAELVVSIEQVLEEMGETPDPNKSQTPKGSDKHEITVDAKPNWKSICFYIAPIGKEGSDVRNHSDLFLEQLVEPAMKKEEIKLDVVRADQIAEPGMITTKILEYIKHAKLVIADLSFRNPNVFYEIALRHIAKLAIVQIVQKSDEELPFDVKDVNTLVIDNTDIYSFVPQQKTYQAQIANLARRAMDDPEHVGNPISVFYPDFWK